MNFQAWLVAVDNDTLKIKSWTLVDEGDDRLHVEHIVEVAHQWANIKSLTYEIKTLYPKAILTMMIGFNEVPLKLFGG